MASQRLTWNIIQIGNVWQSCYIFFLQQLQSIAIYITRVLLTSFQNKLHPSHAQPHGHTYSENHAQESTVMLPIKLKPTAELLTDFVQFALKMIFEWFQLCFGRFVGWNRSAKGTRELKTEKCISIMHVKHFGGLISTTPECIGRLIRVFVTAVVAGNECLLKMNC